MKKSIAFGSSFVQIFFPIESNHFTIVKYKGGMLKGILDKNENYYDMLSRFKKEKYENAFFVLGNPDCNFYYIKKKYIDGEDEKEILNTLYKNVQRYVLFVKNIKNVKRKIIINVAPPIQDDKNYMESIKTYGVITNNNLLKKIKKSDLSHKFRLEIRLIFNSLLKINCEKYGIEFCDTTPYLLDKNGKLENLFKLQHNPVNVHYSFEHVFLVYILTCLSDLVKNEKELKNILKKTEKMHEEYIHNHLSKKHKNINFSNHKFRLHFDEVKKMVEEKRKNIENIKEKLNNKIKNKNIEQWINDNENFIIENKDYNINNNNNFV